MDHGDNLLLWIRGSKLPNVKKKLAIKKYIWSENNKDIRSELDKSDKGKTNVIPNSKNS